MIRRIQIRERDRNEKQNIICIGYNYNHRMINKELTTTNVCLMSKRTHTTKVTKRQWHYWSDLGTMLATHDSVRAYIFLVNKCSIEKRKLMFLVNFDVLLTVPFLQLTNFWERGRRVVSHSTLEVCMGKENYLHFKRHQTTWREQKTKPSHKMHR